MSRYSTPRASHTKEENRTDLEDQPLLENIKCEYHPTFKIDAISTNDKRSNLKLHCIKCIIDCKDFQASDGDRMITIKELIQKSTEPQISNIDKIAKRREALQNTFLDFLTKNYAPLYEQHAEAQFKAVDSEIGDLIEKLNKLRVRYRAYFASKADDINSKVLEIKQNIARFLEDEPILDPSPIFTPSEIHDKMTKISHKDDLLEFLSSIHKKTREPVDIQSTEDSKTLELMNEVKNTYNQSISFCVDMSKLKELNKVVTMFQEKELHIYNKTQQNGFPHQVTISNPLQFSLQPQRQISDDRSMQSASPPPQKKEIKYETFRTLDNLAPSNLSDAERKKLNKRFRHVDIGSTSLRGITKNIASSGDNIDPEVKEKAINQLNEWINRRVTGYLIFQNTMNQNPLEQTDKGNYKELGIHLNNITGQKWKNLNDEDRDEYRNLAKEYRKILRKEIEAYENYDDITDLIEQFDQKIKKIKKE